MIMHHFVVVFWLFLSFLPNIYAFFEIQVFTVLFLETINLFWTSKKLQFSCCLLGYHQNEVKPSTSKYTADKEN